MSIYSKLLARVNPTATGTYALFTAPSGVTTIIRDITGVSTDTGAALTAFLTVGGVGYFSVNALANYNPFHWSGRLVLSPGDAVAWYCDIGYGSVYVSGYELS